MKGVAFLISRFADQEFAIRRAYSTDPEFQELCHYHACALDALEYWKDEARRVSDYRRIVEELEDEILEYLSRKYRVVAR
ncbi:MAG: hypothetical protein KDJ88_21135 [Bauldia sp.]|nr:hypothetical protein [Bauldia sp.]